jgi:hypothetical protein
MYLRLSLALTVLRAPSFAGPPDFFFGGAADLDLLANGLGVLLPPFLAGFFELELSLFEELLPVFFVFITSRISPQRYSKYYQLVTDKMHLLYVR